MKVDNKRALIIGCGKMGCFYDGPDSSDIFTHAHALSLKKFQLSFYDKDFEISTKAAALWGGVATKEMSGSRYDVIVVATSTAHHYDILKKLNPEEFDTLIVEKPFCEKSENTIEMLKKFERNLVFVNYSRLYLDQYQFLKNKILKNELGKCTAFSGIYSRGLLNNGSHLLSLFDYLLNLNFFEILVTNKFTESVSGLVNYDFYLKASDGSRGHLLGIDDSQLPIWEAVLYFEKAVLSINNFGQEVIIRPVTDAAPELIKINYNDALVHLYDKVVSKDGEFAKLTQKNAISVHKILENISEA